MPRISFTISAPFFTLCLLGGTWADRTAHDASDMASDRYVEYVRHQAEAMPLSIGAWLGASAPEPASMIKVHLPDFTLSRTYRNLVTGTRVDLLLVYRRDVRDLMGQWPVGHVDQTWTLQSSSPSDQQVDGLGIATTRYEFVARRTGGTTAVSIDDMFVLPSGRICRDLHALEISATAPSRGALGTLQVQIVSYGRLSGQQRDEITALFVRTARPVIDATSQGGIQ